MGSGPVLAIVGVVLSVGLTRLLGFSAWVVGGLGVAWVAALVFTGLFGHRTFNTRANSDLMMVMVGLAVALAIGIPSYVRSNVCGQAKLVAREVGEAQAKWHEGHGTFATAIEQLELRNEFPEVLVDLSSDGGSWAVTVSHPRCVWDDGGVRRFP